MNTNSNQAAAEVLAAAVLDLFPNALLLGGMGTQRCFFYDFRFSFTPDREALKRIEERMRRLLKEGVKVERREMIAANAADNFKAKGQSFLARKLKLLQKTVVPICAIGEHFIDYTPFPTSDPPTQIVIAAAEALPFLDGKCVRLIGGDPADKKALSALAEPISSQEKLFLPLGDGQWMWLEQVERAREYLAKWWRTEVSRRGFQLVSTLSADETSLLRHHKTCFLKTGCDRLAEMTALALPDYSDPRNGLLETSRAWTDRLSLFFTGEDFLEKCISSLQFIMQLPKILGFEFYVFLGSSTKKHVKEEQEMRIALEKLGLKYSVEKEYRAGRAHWIEIKLCDRLGRLWNGPFMALHTEGDRLICSAFGALERYFGLRCSKDVCELIKREVGSESED